MAKVLYSVAMSLDGFIAGPGGDMSWLRPMLGDDPSPESGELMELIGALLAGRRTFDGDDPHRGDPEREGAFGGAWHGPTLVLTHRPPDVEVPDVTFVTDLDSALEAAKAAAGDRCVNVLGADVARQCLEAGAIDELFVFITPILLGDGVHLFTHAGGMQVDLELLSARESGGSTVLRYRVRR